MFNIMQVHMWAMLVGFGCVGSIGHMDSDRRFTGLPQLQGAAGSCWSMQPLPSSVVHW